MKLELKHIIPYCIYGSIEKGNAIDINTLKH